MTEVLITTARSQVPAKLTIPIINATWQLIVKETHRNKVIFEVGGKDYTLYEGEQLDLTVTLS